jgi:hypothetical protein
MMKCLLFGAWVFCRRIPLASVSCRVWKTMLAVEPLPEA